MKLYLDTEFNGFGGELISMALVCPDGRQWYAAKELRDLSCGTLHSAYDPWVAEHVLPKLEVDELSLAEFKSSFREFIRQFDNPTIICDWHADAIHFCEMLQGDDYGSSLDFACRVTILKTPPGEPRPENPHNALSDAMALMKWHQGTQIGGDVMFMRSW